MASLIKQHGRYHLQFYDADRSPKRRRVPLSVTVKRDAADIQRKLERLLADGRYDPWLDAPSTPCTCSKAVPLGRRQR